MLPGIRRLAASGVLLLSLLTPEARASQAEPGLTGRVLGSPDLPLAGARVELVPVLPIYETGRLRISTGEGPPPATTATTGQDGRFQLTPPAQGSWKVVVRAQGRVSLQYGPLLWIQPGIELPAVLLPPSHPVPVSVIDGGGEPVRDAWVLATDAEEVAEARRAGLWKIEPRAGRTGLDGTVTLAAIAGRPLELHVLPPGGGEEVRQGFTGGTIPLVSSDRPRVLTLKIETAGGSPLPGAQVRIGGMNWPAGFADEQGTLQLSIGAKLSRIRLVAPDGRQKVANLPPDGETPFRVVLSEPRFLTGRVLDHASGKGLRGVLLSPDTDPGAVLKTDEEGRYRLPIPGPGPIVLEARAPGYLPRRLTIPAADAQAGRVPSLSLDRATALAGSVVDEGSHPLPGAVVEAVPRSVLGSRQLSPQEPVVDRATTDSSGRFKLRRLRASESYEIRAIRSGLLTAAQIVAVPAGGLGKPLQLRLHPVRPAQGRIADGEGKAIANARIVLRPATRPGFPVLDPRAEPDLPEGDPARGRSDAQGNFLIAAVPGEEIDVEVTRTGFAPAHRKGIRATGGKGPVPLGTIVLTPGARLAGRVIDARSHPVPDAEIFLLSSPPRGFEIADSLRGRKPQVTSDKEGRFEIMDLARGVPQYLVTRADGYLISLLNGVRAPQEKPIVVRLQRGAALSGRVVDEEERPVEGAHVDLTWLALLTENPKPRPVGKPVVRSAVTDADGRFEIKDSPEGPVTLDVAAQGFISLSEVEAEVPWKDPSHELVLVLTRGSSLAGRITTTAGEPVERARVSVKGGAAWSDAEGLYRIDSVREGVQEVKVFQPDYPPLERELKIEPGENSRDFVLEAGTEVSGRAVDPAGAPVAGARVTLEATRRFGRFDVRQFEAVSGEDGRFSMRPVTAGEYRIAAEAGERRSAERPPLQVAQEPVTGLEIVLQSGAVLSGKVLGLSPEELATVEVQAHKDQGRTVPAHLQAEGRYEVRGLEPGDWLIQANLWQGQRQAQARVVIAPDDIEVIRDLDFGQRVTLSGVVLLNGDPLPDATLSVRGQKLVRDRSVHTDFSGGFRIDDLEPDRYWLGVSHPEKMVTHNQWIDLQTDQEVEIRLEDSSLSGQVLEAGSGKPVPEARITLRPVTGPDFMVSAGAEQDGSFHLFRVPASAYRMQVTADGYQAFEQEILVSAGQELTGFEISLKRAEGLRLQVRRASGETPDLVHVLALAPDGQAAMADTRQPDAAGQILLPNLPAGTWTLLIGASQAAMVTQAVTVPGDLVQVILPGASRFQVRVHDLTTSDVAATLTIWDAGKNPLRTLAPGGRLQQSWPLAGGKGTLDNIPAGVWSVRVQATDGRAWSATLTSLGGGDQTLSIP